MVMLATPADDYDWNWPADIFAAKALTVPELYVLHVKESGRRPDAYQDWLADLLIAVLLAH